MSVSCWSAANRKLNFAAKPMYKLRSKLRKATEEQKKDALFVLNIISSLPECFALAAPELQQDEQFVARAFVANAKTLMYADKSVRSDKEFIKSLILQTPYASPDQSAYKYAHPMIVDEPDLITLALQHKQVRLVDLPIEYRTDEELLLSVCSKQPEQFCFAPFAFKRSKQFVMKLVQLNGCALEGAYDFLKWDPEVVAVAIANNSKAQQFVLTAPIKIATVSDNLNIGKYSSEEAKKKAILAALRLDGKRIVELPLPWSNLCIYTAMKQNPHAVYNLLSETLRSDPEVISQCISAAPSFMFHTILSKNSEQGKFLAQYQREMEKRYYCARARQKEEYLHQIMEDYKEMQELYRSMSQTEVIAQLSLNVDNYCALSQQFLDDSIVALAALQALPETASINIPEYLIDDTMFFKQAIAICPRIACQANRMMQAQNMQLIQDIINCAKVKLAELGTSDITVSDVLIATV